MHPPRDGHDLGVAGDDSAWIAVSLILYVPAALFAMGAVVWQHGAVALGDRMAGEAPLWWLGVGLVAGGGVAVASQLVGTRWEWVRRASDALAAQLGPLTLSTTLILAGLSSIGEEWLFRGWLQPAVGWLPATVVFALVHVPLERALWAWPLMAFGIGLVLAALYEMSGGLVAPIAMHFAINALNLRWLAREAALR